jgi:ribonuclease HI
VDGRGRGVDEGAQVRAGLLGGERHAADASAGRTGRRRVQNQYGPQVTQDLLFDDGPAPAAGVPVVAATDGSARPNPGHAAGAWFVSEDCWAALAVEGTSTNNVGELVAIRALLEAVPPGQPLHVVYDSTYAQKCVTTWVHSWSRGGRVPPERWVTKEGSPVKNADLIGAISALLAGRTVTWSKVKSHTTLMTSEHRLNRAADERAGAVVAALHARTKPPTGPGWTGTATG